MPSKTNTDAIRELQLSVKDLETNWEFLEDLAKKEIPQFRDKIADFAVRLAVLEEKIAKLEKASDDSTRIKWAIGTGLITVVISSLLNYLFRLQK